MRRTIKYTILKKNPYEKWNQYVDLITNESIDDLTQIQCIAHLSFMFDTEMQNGGIIQYFTNSKGEYLEETLEALSSLGADRQRTSLLEAMNLYTTLKISNVESRDEFIKEAMIGYDYKFDIQIIVKTI